MCCNLPGKPCSRLYPIDPLTVKTLSRSRATLCRSLSIPQAASNVHTLATMPCVPGSSRTQPTAIHGWHNQKVVPYSILIIALHWQRQPFLQMLAAEVNEIGGSYLPYIPQMMRNWSSGPSLIAIDWCRRGGRWGPIRKGDIDVLYPIDQSTFYAWRVEEPIVNIAQSHGGKALLDEIKAWTTSCRNRTAVSEGRVERWSLRPWGLIAFWSEVRICSPNPSNVPQKYRHKKYYMLSMVSEWGPTEPSFKSNLGRAMNKNFSNISVEFLWKSAHKKEKSHVQFPRIRRVVN